jgi:hypothetical protein
MQVARSRRRGKQDPMTMTSGECREKLADLAQRVDALGRYL